MKEDDSKEGVECPSCHGRIPPGTSVCPSCRKAAGISRAKESLTEKEKKLLEERLRSLGYL